MSLGLTGTGTVLSVAQLEYCSCCSTKESFHPLQRRQSHPRVEPSTQREGMASPANGMHLQSLRVPVTHASFLEAA